MSLAVADSQVSALQGTSLSADTIHIGLRELNSDISFDAGVNRPSEYSFVLSTSGQFLSKFGSVLYQGYHICSMDRDTAPEQMLHEMEEGLQEIPMTDIEKYDETRVVYVEIVTTDPFYHQALTKAQKKDDNFVLDGDGKVFKFQAMMFGKIPGRAIKLGWRYTFNQILARHVPGVTRESLTEKFGVVV